MSDVPHFTGCTSDHDPKNAFVVTDSADLFDRRMRVLELVMRHPAITSSSSSIRKRFDEVWEIVSGEPVATA